MEQLQRAALHDVAIGLPQKCRTIGWLRRCHAALPRSGFVQRFHMSTPIYMWSGNHCRHLTFPRNGEAVNAIEAIGDTIAEIDQISVEIPAAVHQKRKYFNYSRETIGYFLLRMPKIGAWRLVVNSKKPAISGLSASIKGTFSERRTGWLGREDSNPGMVNWNLRLPGRPGLTSACSAKTSSKMLEIAGNEQHDCSGFPRLCRSREHVWHRQGSLSPCSRISLG